MDQNTNSNFTQNVDTLFSNLENFTKSDAVMGAPVNHEGKTFIPIISVSVGYGSGANPAKMQNNTNNTTSTTSGNSQTMGALGIGAKVTTEAVLLIDNNNVSVLPINAKGTSIVDKIPQIMSNFGMGNQNQNQNQSQSQQNMNPTLP